MNMELVIMDLIMNSGSARSFAMEAIALAKDNDFDGADKAIGEAEASLSEAHKVQTDLIQKEAAGENAAMSLLLVHAQDHLMNAMVVKDLAAEFIALYKKMNDTAQ